MKKTVLHVDDDDNILNFVNLVLTPAGYDIVSFNSVDDLYKSVDILDVKPDLIILDVMIDEVDSGVVAFNRIREQYPSIPLILFTSLGELVLQHFTELPEMVWVLSKPAEPEQLLSIVKSRVG